MPLTLSKICTGIMPSATLRLNAIVAELRAQGQDIISLAAGEPDFDTPANIVSAANKAMAEGGTHYTAVSGLPQLRQAIATVSLKKKAWCIKKLISLSERGQSKYCMKHCEPLSIRAMKSFYRHLAGSVTPKW